MVKACAPGGRVESRPEALVIQDVLETAGIPVVVRTPDKYLLLQGDWRGSPKPLDTSLRLYDRESHRPPVEIWVAGDRVDEAKALLAAESGLAGEGNPF